ncbi:MAG: hypothetical protein KGQ41_05105 [Alphaproteobacteria bacterium]|nr:hypothetical protein [Alphaproteobacteria bacterium]
MVSLNTTFTASDPLPGAEQLHRSAMAILTGGQNSLAGVPAARRGRVPVVTHSGSRRARTFHRAPIALAGARNGATRHFRYHSGLMATTAAGRRTRAANARMELMASRFLMAGSRRHFAAPAVQPLDVLRARAQALNVVGTLRERFRINSYARNNWNDKDDGTVDVPRLRAARGRSMQSYIYV